MRIRYWPFGWPKTEKTIDQQLSTDTSTAERLTPEMVEANITRAGRDEVFRRARALGWGGPAPLWVWNQIAFEVIAGGYSPSDSGLSGPPGGHGLFRSAFGFDL